MFQELLVDVGKPHKHTHWHWYQNLLRETAKSFMQKVGILRLWSCVKGSYQVKVVSGKFSLRKKIRGYLKFLAAHWWIKPQIWPSQHSFALKIMGCGVLLGTVFFMVPIIPYSPLDYLSSPLISHSLPVMHTGMFQQYAAPNLSSKRNKD